MDYHKNIKALDDMVKTYENSSVIMYGLVANWIPTYQFYVALFHSNVKLNESKFLHFCLKYM